MLHYVPLLSLFNQTLIDYPTPSNLNFHWSFGSLAGICLTIQLLTGIFLAMHYSTHINLAFFSVEHIVRDVFKGWLLRFIHANGASLFFLIIYLHIGRGLYFGSYSGSTFFVWVSGVLIFVLMMATAFLGYVLPWGQMSFWGATVITSLFTAIPLVGESIVFWLWGGFSVDNPTLNRFFSLHYLLPFLIVGCVLLHLTLLHLIGSSNPLSIVEPIDRRSFYPYFYHKDLIGFMVLLWVFIFFVGFYPNILGHSDNYIEANPLVTPAHIVPEWYFLPFYAILRSVPSKLGGVATMGLAIGILLLLPLGGLVLSEIKTLRFGFPSERSSFWEFSGVVLLLLWLGARPVEAPYIFITQICTISYFDDCGALREPEGFELFA
jgi:ubiquinol-cytochrome c reductase cytochrome b subunit